MRFLKFESKKVRELRETIWDMQQTIRDKNDYINHLKEENDFLRGRNNLLIDKARRNVVTYKAARHISQYYGMDIPKERIRNELAEILTEAISEHLKIKEERETELGTIYYAEIDIVEGEQK